MLHGLLAWGDTEAMLSLPGNLGNKQSQETLEYTLVKHKGDEKKSFEMPI